MVPTAEQWGVLGPILPSGTVDAAFVGLDGKTYLFSGDRYLRYSGADYATVDVGYPRAIAGDWGGLRRVDASFVLDGTTYLFGLAGELLTCRSSTPPSWTRGGSRPHCGSGSPATGSPARRAAGRGGAPVADRHRAGRPPDLTQRATDIAVTSTRTSTPRSTCATRRGTTRSPTPATPGR